MMINAVFASVFLYFKACTIPLKSQLFKIKRDALHIIVVTNVVIQIENILHDSVHDTYILCDYGSCSLKSMYPEVWCVGGCGGVDGMV